MRRLITASVCVITALMPTVPVAAGPEESGTNGTNGSGSTGYSERAVFAGYREPAREVSEPARGLRREPTHYCVRFPAYEPGVPAPATYTPAELLAFARANTRPLTELPLLACFERDATVSFRVVYAPYDPADPTAGTITTIDDVAAYARELLSVPVPTIVTAPPPLRLITGFETWFDTSATAHTRSAQAGPLWATATAVPITVTLVPEPGHPPIVCQLPVGMRERDQRPDCLRHTYLDIDHRTGTRDTTATLTVTYEVVLVTSDDPTPRVVDTIDTTTTIPITIREIQTVLR